MGSDSAFGEPFYSQNTKQGGLTMNIQDFANKLNGREYMKEITREEELEAKELGFVVVFGASDDLVEFRGAIYDETGCYKRELIHLDSTGLFEKCEDDDCKYTQAALKKTKVIEAMFAEPGSEFAWSFKVDIPHATFDIMEEGEKFCRGIVFDIRSLVQEEPEDSDPRKCKHDWVQIGGVSCPLEMKDDCNQGRYQCSKCGEVDYGEPGGPGFNECAICYYQYAHKKGNTYHAAFNGIKSKLEAINDILSDVLRKE